MLDDWGYRIPLVLAKKLERYSELLEARKDSRKRRLNLVNINIAVYKNLNE